MRIKNEFCGLMNAIMLKKKLVEEGIKSSGMWCCVTGQVVFNVLKDRSTLQVKYDPTYKGTVGTT